MRKIALTLLSCLLAACGAKKSASEESAERRAREQQLLAPVVEKHRATVEPIFQALRAADDDAIAAPPIEAPAPLATKLAASRARPDQLDLELDGILIASPGWLRGPVDGSGPKLPLWPRLVSAPELKTLFAEGYWDVSGYATTDQVEGALTTLAKVHKILFVRTHDYTAPTVDDSTKTYTPGHAAGDVIVYSIPDGKRLGALPFVVEQTSEKVKSMGLSGGDAVNLDFKRQVLRAVIDLVVAGPS